MKQACRVAQFMFMLIKWSVKFVQELDVLKIEDKLNIEDHHKNEDNQKNCKSHYSRERKLVFASNSNFFKATLDNK